MAYASSASLIARYDERTLSELVSDDGTPQAISGLAADTKILAALADASGDLNSAVMVGGLYSADDLADLVDDDLEYLKRLTCDLAMGYLMARRPEKYSPDSVGNIVAPAREALELLRQGKHCFNVARTKRAGQPEIDGPTAVTYERLNLIPDRVKNYYPARNTRLPVGRG